MDPISRALDIVKGKLTYAEVKIDEPLKNHTSFNIGGPVRAMFFPESRTCMAELCDLLYKHEITPFIIGKGTNILADDKKLDIIVINTKKLKSVELTGQTEITAESGVMLSSLAVFAYESGLSGLEFAHGIPGTLGGAVVMNAGAYGGEMKDVVSCTTAYDPKGGEYTITDRQHEFSYRHSRFSDSNDIVISSIIRLMTGDKEDIKSCMDDLNVRRRESQPLDLPSAGSVFKRPKDGYAAAFIEEAGLKGFAIGGAMVSSKHSGFIVNRGDATFSDVMAVIEYVQNMVYKQFGIELEPEIRIVK